MFGRKKKSSYTDDVKLAYLWLDDVAPCVLCGCLVFKYTIDSTPPVHHEDDRPQGTSSQRFFCKKDRPPYDLERVCLDGSVKYFRFPRTTTARTDHLEVTAQGKPIVAKTKKAT